MVKKQKGQKVSLSTFLQDDTLGGGSWADEDVDFSSISVPVVGSKSGFDDSHHHENSFGGGDFDRQVRREFPVPDAPPYKARISNLPWEITDEEIGEYLENKLGENVISKLVVPKENGKLKGYGFITFADRDVLVNSLDISGEELNGRRVYLAVAAPDKGGFGGFREGGGDFDWGKRTGPLPPREGGGFRDGGFRDGGFREGGFRDGGFRDGGFGEDNGGNNFSRGPRREEPDLDWGAKRGPLPGDEHRERRAPRREEPNIDWGAKKGPLPPMERQERRGGNFDRGFDRSGPKKEEPQLDWGAKRGPLAPAKKFTPKKDEPNLDWGTARKSHAKKSLAKKEEPQTQSQQSKGTYHILDEEGA